MSEVRVVKLAKSEYLRILEGAQNAYPNEGCGLIAGFDDGNVRHIEKVYILNNIDNSPEHFSLDPKEQLSTIKDAREYGLKVLGNWHSHPQTPSRPSEEDKRLAFDKNASYFIISLKNGNIELNSFHVENNESTKEILEISN